jgi:hypothetical protein
LEIEGREGKEVQPTNLGQETIGVFAIFFQQFPFQSSSRLLLLLLLPPSSLLFSQVNRILSSKFPSSLFQLLLHLLLFRHRRHRRGPRFA